MTGYASATAGAQSATDTTAAGDGAPARAGAASAASVLVELRSVNGRFLDLGMPAERGLYSDDTARLIDDEIKQIISGAHNEARRILREHREVLERVTRRLLEKEVMEGDELRELMIVNPEPASAQLDA